MRELAGLRFSREEVTYILTYGRPFSPMPAWGLNGGGPLNDQQLQNLIDYLESIQITPEQSQQAARDGLKSMMDLKMANWAHLFGMVSGIVLAIAHAAWKRMQT